MPQGKPPKALVTNFYGREFNSPRNVVIAKNGLIWFTDPCTGFDLDFRNKPQLPCHIYCFDPKPGGELRAMADGFGRPTGLAFSPDETVFYVSDTEAVCGDGTKDATRYHTSSHGGLVTDTP